VTPITTFAGRKVAVFGLGGSGLVSASALLAGGADVIGFDDDAASVAKANAAGIPICTRLTGRESPPWCWRRACR
jgi:UDP-N-acetylmuramoylalanine--D-glutamate ligase